MILYVISVGLSVTMGLMGFINLAHGVFAMAGGYVFSTVMARLGVPFPLALLIAFAAVALGSIVLERLLYSRLYTAGELAQVLFTIGLIYASVAVALGSGLAGLGGALGADILPVDCAYPFEHLAYFLIVVAVGGLGSLRGPFIAALLIGVADTACNYWVPELGAFLIYTATMAILLWRPM